MSCCGCLPTCRCLQAEEQMLLEGVAGRRVINGPGCFCVGCCINGTVRPGYSLQDNEYMKLKDILTSKISIVPGPIYKFLDAYDEIQGTPKHQATTLQKNQYLLVEDQMNGSRKVVQGPALFFPGPYDNVKGPLPAIELQDTQFVRVKNLETGKITVVKGPKLFFPGPFEAPAAVESAIALDNTQYIKVIDNESGKIWIEVGPQLFFPGPYHSVGKVAKAYSLDDTQYLKVGNTETGKVKVVKGPRLFIPGPYDNVSEVLQSIALSHNEYVKIVDTETGLISVVRGKAKVFLDAYQEVKDAKHNRGIRTAVNVDEHTAVLVRNTEMGQLYLVRRRELFFPTAVEEIVEVRKKIVLQDHETMVIRDKGGKYHFLTGGEQSPLFKINKEIQARILPTVKEHETKVEKALTRQPREKKESGKPMDDERLMMPTDDDILDVLYSENAGRSFFLPPYCEIVKFHWDTDGDKSTSEKLVERIDMRPLFLEYKFTCRTSDNVELEIEVTFFWQVVDVQAMLKKTDDAPGDLCSHARSVAIQEVSTITMEKFMKEFNRILYTAILERQDPFYEERGCVIHQIEVKAYHCKDPKTEIVLQEIIKERTDRLNRIQKQESENEVKLFKMKGQIEEEKLNGELLKIRHSHHRAEAAMEGEAEADRLKMFLDGLPNIPIQEKFQMWLTLRKLDQIKALAGTNSTLYFTPDQVDLSIGNYPAPARGHK